MDDIIKSILTEIFSKDDKPSRSCPGYDSWLAEQVWEKAKVHFAEKCGPICSSVILDAAGIACCEQNEHGGPGWIGVV